MDSSFFGSLYTSEEFTKALGRLVMASAKFETAIKSFIDSKGEVEYGKKSTLGKLLRLLVDNHTIDSTAVGHFGYILHERNFFVHKLHINLSSYPEDKEQMRRFINRANGTADEMDFFSSILLEHANKNA